MRRLFTSGSPRNFLSAPMTLTAFARHLAFAALLALISAALVKLMIDVAILDRPDPRKAHSTPIPKGGGIGIVAAFLLGIATLYEFAFFARLADPYFRNVIFSSLLIAVVSLLDDIWNWPFFVKLGAQLAAAPLTVGSGLYVRNYHLPFIGTVETDGLGAFFSLIWILFVTNAMNFIDGLDGLAAGVGLIAALFLSYIGAEKGGWFVYFASLLLAAGIAGFLPFNFPRARIFMGDVGSQFLGFVFAVLGIVASRFDRVEMSFLLVPILLSGVLFDVAFTLVRRALAGERLTTPHRGHLYQVAARSGLSPRLVTLIHWGFALWGGVSALIFIALSPAAKLFALLLPLLPQLVWTLAVYRMAKRAAVRF